MGPKKKKASENMVRSIFDMTRFVSLVHEQRFNNLTRNRNPIRERGIDLKEGEFNVIRAEIERRHWGELLKPSREGCLDLVWEFYANAYIPEKTTRPEYKSYVSGATVPYDSRIIDKVLGVTFDIIFD